MRDLQDCVDYCQFTEMKETLDRLRAENATLKTLLAKVPGKCIYCGLEDWSRCERGFPGCARADDLICGEDEAFRALAEERNTLRTENDEMRELVREALNDFNGWGGHSHDWLERAENALGD